jgi:ubiquinone/menaquinone biosynthesis C-methylase UbiE
VLNRARAEVGEAAGDGRVLEIGIGTGASLRHYRPAVELTGIDLSPGMLGVARRHSAELGLAAKLLEMDAERLRFPDSSFDAVVFDLCLCTVPDPAQAIAEGIRVARPGARMIFLEHVRSRLPPVAVLQELLTVVTALTQHDHWNRRTPDLVRAAGVRVISERRWLLGVFTLIVGEAPAAGRSD